MLLVGIGSARQASQRCSGWGGRARAGANQQSPSENPAEASQRRAAAHQPHPPVAEALALSERIVGHVSVLVSGVDCHRPAPCGRLQLLDEESVAARHLRTRERSNRRERSHRRERTPSTVVGDFRTLSRNLADSRGISRNLAYRSAGALRLATPFWRHPRRRARGLSHVGLRATLKSHSHIPLSHIPLSNPILTSLSHIPLSHPTLRFHSHILLSQIPLS